MTPSLDSAAARPMSREGAVISVNLGFMGWTPHPAAQPVVVTPWDQWESNATSLVHVCVALVSLDDHVTAVSLDSSVSHRVAAKVSASKNRAWWLPMSMSSRSSTNLCNTMKLYSYLIAKPGY